MKTARTLGVLVLAGLIAAGCSSTAATAAPTTAAAPTAEPTAPPTAPPTATPEPTIDLAPVGAAWLAMSTALNAANAAAIAGLNAATSDDELSDAYQLFVDGDQIAIDAIKAITFPPDIQDEATSWVAALDKHRIAMAQLVSDPQDPDPTIDTRVQEAADESVRLATAIRAALGLPPPATPAPAAT